MVSMSSTATRRLIDMVVLVYQSDSLVNGFLTFLPVGKSEASQKAYYNTLTIFCLVHVSYAMSNQKSACPGQWSLANVP